MSAEILSENLRPVEVLDVLIARHGLLRVLLALLKPRPRPMRLRPPIPDHLARDIGLLQEPAQKIHWDYR